MSLHLQRKTIPFVIISRVFPVAFKTVETHFSLCLKSSDHRQIGPRENVRTPTCYGQDLDLYSRIYVIPMSLASVAT